MKRVLFSLVLFFTFVAIHAQVNVEKVATIPSLDFELIPSFFCKGEKPIMVSRNWEDGFWHFNCYDSSLNQIHHFTINKEKLRIVDIEQIPFVDYDTNYGKAETGHIVRYFQITQTLFNDDNKFEFVANVYSDPDNPSTREMCICNEDGDILQKLDINGHFYLIKLNDEYYFLLYGSEDGYDFYKITKGGSTGTPSLNIAKTTHATPRYYDLNGTSVNPNTTKGKVIIKTDGTTSEKVLIK